MNRRTTMLISLVLYAICVIVLAISSYIHSGH